MPANLAIDPKAKGIKNLEVLARCPWFDYIRFGYGVQTHYRIRSKREGVSVIVRRRDGKFVMIRQRRPFFDTAKLEFINGSMDARESPQQTAKREVLEETGYKVISLRSLMTLSTHPALVIGTAHCFVAKVENHPHGKPSEKDLPDSQVELLTLNQLLRALRQDQLISYAVANLLYYLYTENKFLPARKPRRIASRRCA